MEIVDRSTKVRQRSALVSCPRNNRSFVAVKMGRRWGNVSAGRRVGVWAFEKGFVEPAGHYSHVDRQSYFRYADTQKRRCADTLRHAGPF